MKVIAGKPRKHPPSTKSLYILSIMFSSIMVINGYESGGMDLDGALSFLALLMLWSIVFTGSLIPWTSAVFKVDGRLFFSYLLFLTLLLLAGLVSYSKNWDYWAIYPYILALMFVLACFRYFKRIGDKS